MTFVRTLVRDNPTERDEVISEVMELVVRVIANLQERMAVLQTAERNSGTG